MFSGSTSFGAQLSINVGGFSFQPSEFVKISFVFFVATMFYRSIDFRTIVITTVVVMGSCAGAGDFKGFGKRSHFFVTYLLMLLSQLRTGFIWGAGAGCGVMAATVAL